MELRWTALDALCVDHTVDGCVRGDRFAPIDGPPSSPPGARVDGCELTAAS